MTELKTLQYPRHIHRDGQFKIVNDAAACDAAMDDGWTLSPNDPARPYKTPATEPEPVGSPLVGSSIVDGNATEAIAEIKTLTDIGALQALSEVEVAGKNRKGVLAAIESRITALEADQHDGHADVGAESSPDVDAASEPDSDEA